MTIMGLADSKVAQNMSETYAQIGKELKTAFSTLLSRYKKNIVLCVILSSDWTYFHLEFSRLSSGLNLLELVPVGNSVKVINKKICV